MEKHRTLSILTPHGPTKELKPGRGLAQGGILSPTLWNIFYNPLLLRLQKKTNGYTIPHSNDNIRLTHAAFADDLHNIATDNKDFQLQLDLIYNFLQFHHMEMNVLKTKVLSNQPSNHELFPTQETFKLGEEHIKTIVPAKNVSRMLGVYLSMDGQSKATRDHAIDSLKTQLNSIRNKFMPGKLSAHLLTTIWINRTLYRLQLSFLSEGEYKKIDTMCKMLVKKSSSLLTKTPSTILHDKNFNYNLGHFKTLHTANMITNAMVLHRSTGQIGEIMEAFGEYQQTTLKLPLPLIEAPINYNGKTQGRSYAKNLSTIMYQNGLRMRNADGNSLSNHFYDKLSIEEYSEHHKNLLKYKLDRDSIVNFTNTKTLTFSLFAHNLDNLSHKQDLTESYFDIAPPWFNAATNTIASLESITAPDEMDIYRQKHILQNTEVAPEHINLDIHNSETLTIYTDGSYDSLTGEMGAACVFLTPDQRNPLDGIELTHTRKKVQHTNPSALKAEKFGIYIALHKCHPDTKVTVVTDSESSIKTITTASKGETTRQIIRQDDYQLNEAITHQFKKFATPPVLKWIARNSGNTHNKRADSLAKLARIDRTVPFQSILPFKERTPLKRDYHFFKQQNIGQEQTRLDLYCRKFVLDQSQLEFENKNIKLLNTIWPNADTEIFNQKTYLLTAQATSMGLHRENFLDVNNYKIQAFRIKVLTRKLQSRTLLDDYDFMSLSDTLCYKCRELETPEHIFTCPYTKTLFPEIIQQAKENLRIEISLHWNKKKKPTEPKYSLNLQNYYINFLIEADGATFLNDPQARGIANEEQLTNLGEQFQTPKLLPGTTWIYCQILASFTKALYEKVWRPRTAQVYKESDNNKNAEAQNAQNNTSSEHDPSSSPPSDDPPNDPLPQNRNPPLPNTTENADPVQEYIPNHPRPNFTLSSTFEPIPIPEQPDQAQIRAIPPTTPDPNLEEIANTPGNQTPNTSTQYASDQTSPYQSQDYSTHSTSSPSNIDYPSSSLTNLSTSSSPNYSPIPNSFTEPTSSSSSSQLSLDSPNQHPFTHIRRTQPSNTTPSPPVPLSLFQYNTQNPYSPLEIPETAETIEPNPLEPAETMPPQNPVNPSRKRQHTQTPTRAGSPKPQSPPRKKHQSSTKSHYETKTPTRKKTLNYELKKIDLPNIEQPLEAASHESSDQDRQTPLKEIRRSGRLMKTPHNRTKSTHDLTTSEESDQERTSPKAKRAKQKEPQIPEPSNESTQTNTIAPENPAATPDQTQPQEDPKRPTTPKTPVAKRNDPPDKR
jgi:ribonuclease HI